MKSKERKNKINGRIKMNEKQNKKTKNKPNPFPNDIDDFMPDSPEIYQAS